MGAIPLALACILEMRWPPVEGRYLARCHMQKWVRCPLCCDTISKGYCRISGGISLGAAKCVLSDSFWDPKPQTTPNPTYFPREPRSAQKKFPLILMIRGPGIGGWIVVVGFGVFGAPRFSVQRPQSPLKQAFWDLWTENRGAPKTPNPSTTDPTPCSPLWYKINSAKTWCIAKRGCL